MRTDNILVKALFVSVHYGNPQPTVDLLRCLSRIERRSDVGVLVVSNKSIDGSGTGLREAISGLADIELLELSANAGYFGAAQAGLDRFLERQAALPDWIIVCNHDVLIEDRDFFLRLFAQDPSAVGVIAPRIVIPSQAVEQNPFMKTRPGWWRRFTMRLYISTYSAGVTWDWLSRKKRTLRSCMFLSMSRPQSNGGRETIYAAHGAFMIFSRRFFEAGGTLDDQLFLFGEEISVAETCRALRLPIVYDPTLSVLHNEHQGVGKGMSRLMFGYHRQSVRHVLSKYLAS
jgi:GT2 family glycosyltransferase